MKPQRNRPHGEVAYHGNCKVTIVTRYDFDGIVKVWTPRRTYLVQADSLRAKSLQVTEREAELAVVVPVISRLRADHVSWRKAVEICSGELQMRPARVRTRMNAARRELLLR